MEARSLKSCQGEGDALLRPHASNRNWKLCYVCDIFEGTARQPEETEIKFSPWVVRTETWNES